MSFRPEGSTAADTVALLKFGRANGFFFAACWGLLRTLISDYSRLRSRLGLTAYSEADMIAKLSAAGFSATRAPKNIGHNPIPRRLLRPSPLRRRLRTV